MEREGREGEEGEEEGGEGEGKRVESANHSGGEW